MTKTPQHEAFEFWCNQRFPRGVILDRNPKTGEYRSGLIHEWFGIWSAAVASVQPATAELPWSDLKVVFDLDFDPDVLWAARDSDKLDLPSGWKLKATDCSGARCVAIFRVEGVPSLADGEAVAAAIERLKP